MEGQILTDFRWARERGFNCRAILGRGCERKTGWCGESRERGGGEENWCATGEAMGEEGEDRRGNGKSVGGGGTSQEAGGEIK